MTEIKEPHILWDGTVFAEARLQHMWHQIMKWSHYQEAPFSKVPSFTEVADLQKASFQHTMHNRPKNGHGTRPYQWYMLQSLTWSFCSCTITQQMALINMNTLTILSITQYVKCNKCEKTKFYADLKPRMWTITQISP